MNLFFRMFFLFLFARTKQKLNLLDKCSTPFRVLPSDIDILGHMNNGVYFSLQDLARADFALRNGTIGKIRANKWIYVVAGENIQFRKSLGLFKSFTLTSEVMGWDDRTIIFEHKFIRDDEVYAFGWARLAFLDKDLSPVHTKEIREAFGVDQDTRKLPDEVEIWTHSLDLHRQKASRL